MTAATPEFTDRGREREIQITLRDFLMVIFRRKWIILSMVLVTSSVVFTALMLTPVTYTSHAKVLVWGLQRASSTDRTMLPMQWEEILTSESELVDSKPILDQAQAVLDAAAAKGEPRYKLESGKITATPLEKSRVLFLSYSAATPEESQKVCDAVTNAYMQYHETLFALPDIGAEFDQEIKRNDAIISDLLTRRLEVKEANDVSDIAAELENLHTVLVSHRIKLTDIDAEVAYIRAEISAADALAKNPDLTAPINIKEGRFESGALQTMTNNLAVKQAERERLLTLYTERHPDVIQIDNEIEAYRNSLAQQVEQVRAKKEGELVALSAERDVLSRRIGEIEDRLRLLPAAERDLSALENDIDAARRNQDDISHLRAQASISTNSLADYHVALLSPAGYGAASNPRDLVRMSLGPLLSLLVGIGLAFFFDSLDHSLKNPEEVERYLDLPVLTSVRRRRARELSASF